MEKAKHPVFHLPQEVVFAPGFLQQFLDRLNTWSLDLFDSKSGGFRKNSRYGVNIMSSTDIVWIRYAAQCPSLPERDHKKLIAYLQNAQDSTTGRVVHDPALSETIHSDGQAFWDKLELYYCEIIQRELSPVLK